MRAMICLTAASFVLLGSTQALARSIASDAPAPNGFQLDETTWTFERNGAKVQESIDAKGNFISNTVEGKHLDHGTSVMKNNKACFTSLMTKEGEVCWTTKPVAVGESLDTVSNRGEKLRVTRIKYVPMGLSR